MGETVTTSGPAEPANKTQVALIRRALDRVQKEPRTDAERARRLGVSLSTFYRWKAALAKDPPDDIRAPSDRTELGLKRYLELAPESSEAAYVAGVAAAIRAARRALDDVEAQLIATKPASVAEPADMTDAHDAAAAERAASVSPATRGAAESEKDRRRKTKPA